MLTNKQKIFCEEYQSDLNATQAAIRAGYSKATAKQQGSRLLTNVDVQAEVQRLIAERAEKVGLDGEEILKEIKRLALASEDDVPHTLKMRTLELAGKHLNLWDRDQGKAPRVEIVLEGKDLLL